VNDPFRTFDELRQTYLRYLDSPFWLRYPALVEERRQLLDQDRQLYREPLFEPVVPYSLSGLTARDACTRLGVPTEAADYMGSGGLFPVDRELFQHQFDAWQASRTGKAVVVTTGTGSGKTECYLLPVFAYLVEESLRWAAPAPRPTNALWWNYPRQGRISQRVYDTGHPKAVRALFLYPLNALIEDQLGRIRRASDSRGGRGWLDVARHGNRFWFGRYTSLTPVPGPTDNAGKREEMKRRLQDMEREWRGALRSAQIAGEDQILSYYQDPVGSEMWSRWDMHDAPPDILITNYSMLNIMLMRSLESGIFDQTKTWLEADRERNWFHLVVDELHTYRGTPGTEVGYLLRTLLHRLGLSPDSPQLRIIATSASIERNDPRSIEYLEQFFGRDSSTFQIFDGKRHTFPAGGTIPSPVSFCAFGKLVEHGAPQPAVDGLAVDAGIPIRESTPPLRIGELFAATGVLERVRSAGERAPFTAEALGASVFPGSPDSEEAARGIIRGLIAAREKRGNSETAPLPLRVHYFFHNAGRLWACVNPNCTGRTGGTPAGAPVPPLGCLYTEPQPRCEHCDSRVLEMLYCQPCGEVFIGGYKDPDPAGNNAWFLSPDFPDLERVPDRSASLERQHGEYLVFWPACGRALARSNYSGPSWRWQQDNQQWFQWRPASLQLIEGRLALTPARYRAGQHEVVGYAFDAPIDDTNAFPAKCPHCAADWGRRSGVKSPIRDLGTGFQRIMQILGDGMIREIPAGLARKLVLFSDSRLDAAKLSTGIKLSHYRDTVRQIAFSALIESGLAAAVRFERQQKVHAQ
jgi:DEAD/DEAH box helicase domain-containing protein